MRAKIVIVPMGEADLVIINRLAGTLGPFSTGASTSSRECGCRSRPSTKPATSIMRDNSRQTRTRQSQQPRDDRGPYCEEDIYLPNALYLLGYADTLAGTAIVSLFHFRQEFYGLPEDETKVYPRLFKEVVHQLAGLYAIPPCANPVCVHYESREMLDIDDKSVRLCDICLRSLQKVHIV